MFGFCQTKNHNDCPVEFEHFYFEQRKGKRGVMKTVMVKTEEMVKCDCTCHSKKGKK